MFLLGFAMMLMNYPVTMSRTHETANFCRAYHPQKSMDIDEMLGSWYVVEIMEHKEGMLYGRMNHRACPTIHLEKESRSDLMLTWDETKHSTYYRIRVDDPLNPGYWVASGPHSAMSDSGIYETVFTGMIQVSHVVRSHMVLTFCLQDSDKFFSILVSREPWLPMIDIRGAHSLLPRKGLEIFFVKRTSCSRAPGILGQWYIIETMDHKPGPTGSINRRSCPKIHIDVEKEIAGSDLRLTWAETKDENTHFEYYLIRIVDRQALHPSFWNVSGPHLAITMSSTYQTMFSGTIELSDVVYSHMVLTFRLNDSNKFFSVLVARERWLSENDVEDVHLLLQKEGFEIFFVTRTCENKATGVNYQFFGYHLILIILWKCFL